MILARLMNEHNITPKFLRHLSAFYERLEELEKHWVAPFHVEKHGDVLGERRQHHDYYLTDQERTHVRN